MNLSGPDSAGHLTYWTESVACCDKEWEDAYSRFESPSAERAKFVSRLRKLNVDSWDRESRIVDLCCGRGNGLHALGALGFTRLEGVDLSASLLSQYTGHARLYVGDCRDLKLATGSRDAVTVQGGLHHLPAIPSDLNATLDEVLRVLRPGGRIVIVEPWLTPFLRVVHRATQSRLARRTWGKLDALATMIEREADTYFNWLGRREEILSELTRRFQTVTLRESFGKLLFVGEKQSR